MTTGAGGGRKRVVLYLPRRDDPARGEPILRRVAHLILSLPEAQLN